MFLITEKAQTFAIRFTVHHKPSSNMGCLRPYGCSPNIDDCSFTCGGDCEAIEHYVLDMGFPNIRLQNY